MKITDMPLEVPGGPEPAAGKLDTSLLPEAGLILCAVSGGADSMYLLERLRELGYAVAAAHYDHGLRGEASRGDAAFVRDWCRERDIPCVCGEGDVAAYAARNRVGVEEAARTLRYAFLEQAAEELDASVIATAHTADDNAETVLLRLARGAGPKGLSGIPPRRGRIVRPMLGVTREEVEAYLLTRGIPHREDGSNASDDYARNRVRHHVMPLMTAENPGFLKAVERTARVLREDEAYLDGLAAAFLEERLRDNELSTAALLALPKPVARRAIRRITGDIPLEHTERILSLAETGGTADIPGMRITVSAGKIVFGAPEDAALPDRILRPGETLELPEAGLFVISEKIDAYPDDVHKSFNTFFFLCENIYDTMRVTARHPGDAYRPLGRGCTKTLKALFLENSVPVWERDRIPVLRDGAGVLAVCGMPQAERAAAKPGDKGVLKIEFIRREPAEGRIQ